MKKPEFITRHFPDDATLKEIKAWIRSNYDVGQGVICPACSRKVKLYHRIMSLAPAEVLRELFRERTLHGDDYIDLDIIFDRVGRTARQGGYGLLGQHWDMIEQMDGERADGSKRVGFWRINDKGCQFVRGEITVPRVAYVFLGKARGYSTDHTTMSKALKEPFDYRKIMGDEDDE